MEGLTHTCLRTLTLVCTVNTYARAHMHARTKKHMHAKVLSYSERFINESLHNVIAVHCKGGKGRTGVFVCAWLRYSGFHDSSQGAMSYFAERRTGEHARVEQGVSGAAQRRYGVCVCVCCVCVRV